jgi:cellulose synthase/poly-beta-1,6-N-acetylglucosamine synthase-like glycosyltransferase
MRDERTKINPVIVDKPPFVGELNLGVLQESETVDSNHHEANRLNANPNPQHPSYKILGILSWSVLIFCFVSLVVAPRLMLEVARVVAIYMMLRFIGYMFLYLGGLAHIRVMEKRASSSPYKGLPNREMARNKAVHHLVVIPNYNEPPEVLARTLHSLWVQEGARQHMTVVLAMEERESEARTKAQHLLAHHKGKFFHLMATFHPADLPGEAPGKGVNDTWAVRCARRELVERMGIPADSIVVTVSDSDSILHPYYFAELTRQFAADARRYSLVWQSPILFDNDIWQTKASIRLLTFFSNAVTTADYMSPLEAKFPYSTYSISLKLLEEVNYWDPTVIAEDVNIYMRAFFARGGKAWVKRIYLPTRGNPIYGARLWDAIVIFYNQKVRHAWGGVEIGYLFQKWNSTPRAPFFYILGRQLKLFHDHLFFSTAGFIVTLGTVLSIALDHTAVITLPPVSFSPVLFAIINLLGGSALIVIWFSERIRLSRGWRDWNLPTLLREVSAWVIFPVLSFLLMNLPGLQAQTKMVLGQPFYFNRTPKDLDSKVGQ